MGIEDTLAKVELFSELAQSDLARLAELTVVREFKKGDVVVREGDMGIAFYVIASGSVEVLKGLDTDHEQALATMGPENFFGEMSLFDNQVRSASVRCLEDTQFLMLTKWDFNAELQGTGCRMATTLLSILARRIRALDEAATH